MRNKSVKKYAKCIEKILPLPYRVSIKKPQNIASAKLLIRNIKHKTNIIDRFNGNKNIAKNKKIFDKILNILFFVR